MPIVSVLMSVYNESESEIFKSINSILNQTMTDFEFIIVCDDPSNTELINLLKKYEVQDERIRIVLNETNIGLAMSLNHGFEYASGQYIARMDADDISDVTRFEKQLSYIKNHGCDLVWSAYEYIDEKDEILLKDAEYISDEQIQLLLPQKNIIHHPTVFMTYTALKNVGMYRNFPCAQDYDLWLRMLSSHYKMKMMPEKLLKYRVRTNSTTSKKKYQQLCTLNYIRSLYKEREKKGSDSYSYDNYINNMQQVGVGNKRIESDFIVANQKIAHAKSLLSQHKLFGALKIAFSAVIISKAYRRQIGLYIRRKIGV